MCFNVYYSLTFYDPVLFSYIMNGIRNIAYIKNLHAFLIYFSAGVDKIQGGITAPLIAKYININQAYLFN